MEKGTGEKGTGRRAPGTQRRGGGRARQRTPGSSPLALKAVQNQNIAPARRVANRILLQIETSEAHSDDLLRSPEVDALSAVDRNLATTLVLGTLRWQLALDARIRELLTRPDAKLSAEGATALRMGAYQLLYLDRVPAHAVLHDSVELVKQSSESSAAGMVNAVLRKIQATGNRSPVAETGARVAEASPGHRKQDNKHRVAAELAAQWAHPEWMVERWVRCHGTAAAEAICRWDQEPAGTAVRAEPDAGLDDLVTEPGFFLRCAQRVVQGNVSRTEAFRTGRVRIQDEASQLVAEIAAAAAMAARKVLDTCAAPGGKTAILAERIPEAQITAVDVSQSACWPHGVLTGRAALRLLRTRMWNGRSPTRRSWNCGGSGT